MSQAFDKVTAVDINRRLVDACRENLARNGATNVSVVRADCKKYCNMKSVRENRSGRVVLVDPPRCGLNDEGIRKVVASHDHVMWISCNPETLVADLARVFAISPSLRIERFAFFDHFPYTKYVEVGVYLSRCRVGIVGGGIGGLALAVALKQRGIDCRVFERDASFAERSQGYGLTLQQGAKTIRDLSLSSALESSSIYSPTHFIFDSKGQTVAFWGPTRLKDSSDAAEQPRPAKRKARHNVQISRQALRRGLLQACEELVAWDSRVSGVSQGRRRRGSFICRRIA